MKPLRLRTSLTLVYTGLLAVLVTSVALGYHQLLVRQVDIDATTELDELVRGLLGYVQVYDGRLVLDYERSNPEAAAFVEDATRYYQVYDAASGQLIEQSPAFNAAGVDYTAGEVAQFRERRGMHDVQTDRGRIRIADTVVSTPSGAAFLVQVGLPLDRVDRAIAALERLLLWGIAASVGISAGVGRWMSGWALAPLSRLAQATRQIDIDNLSRRLPVRGAEDELDEVTLAFNQALHRVERAVNDMRQFSAALAHELRTPLAILRGETELALTRAQSPAEVRLRLETQLEEFDRLNALITQILTLARAEAGQIVVAMTPLDLAALSAAIVEQMDPVAEARGIALTYAYAGSSGEVIVSGNAGWLERLLLILIDNALKFTPQGGRVTVRVFRADAVGNIAIEDTGIGIATEELPHVFEPFYRADPSRSRQTEGAGLGLALAKWIADRHHATIEVTSHPDEGSAFVLSIPLVAGQTHS